MQLVLFFHFSCVTLSFLSEDPSFQTRVNCLSHFEPTFSSLYISMFIHDITHTVTHQEAAGGRVAGCCKFPRWQYVKGRHRHKGIKKMAKFNCCTMLGIVIWDEHLRHYAWYVQRWFIQITSSRWRLELCTFQRNKHGLFCIADSQGQANIERQRGSKTCSNNVTACRLIWWTQGTLLPLAMHAISSLKLQNLHLFTNGRQRRRQNIGYRTSSRSGFPPPVSRLVLYLNTNNWGVGRFYSSNANGTWGLTC